MRTPCWEPLLKCLNLTQNKIYTIWVTKLNGLAYSGWFTQAKCSLLWWRHGDEIWNRNEINHIGAQQGKTIAVFAWVKNNALYRMLRAWGGGQKHRLYIGISKWKVSANVVGCLLTAIARNFFTEVLPFGVVSLCPGLDLVLPKAMKNEIALVLISLQTKCNISEQDLSIVMLEICL